MSNRAETYESYMVPSMFAPLAEDLIALANPHLGERVLDVACGTGILARRLAHRLDGKVDVTGAVGEIKGIRTRVIKTQLVRKCAFPTAPPGMVLDRDGEMLLIQCGDGPLRIVRYEIESGDADGGHHP